MIWEERSVAGGSQTLSTALNFMVGNMGRVPQQEHRNRLTLHMAWFVVREQRKAVCVWSGCPTFQLLVEGSRILGHEHRGRLASYTM